MVGQRDKYLLVALICSFVLIASSFIPFNSENENTIIGFVSDTKESDSGYVSIFVEENGTHLRCFSKSKMETNTIYEISGSYSDDKTIFFVSSFTLCQTP